MRRRRRAPARLVLTPVHRPTVDIYEADAAGYAERRGVQREERVAAFAAALGPDGLRLDLGCGPGHYLPLLGRPAVSVDAAAAMAQVAARAAPDVPAGDPSLSSDEQPASANITSATPTRTARDAVISDAG